jgi:hypothetical protein
MVENHGGQFRDFTRGKEKERRLIGVAYVSTLCLR